MAGEEAGDIHTASRTYDVNVWSVPEARNSLTDIEQLLIDTPDGGQVPLWEVADVRIEPVPNAINRENLARRINVEAEVEGRDLGSVVAEVEKFCGGLSSRTATIPSWWGNLPSGRRPRAAF